MKRIIRSMPCLALLLAAAATPTTLAALDHHEEGDGHNAAYVSNLAFVGGRVVELAEAIPEENYGWRPMEGVRSVSESIMHMASASYFFASKLGTPVPEGIDMQNMETVTAKADCIAALQASIDHLSQSLGATADGDAAVDIFGRPGTKEDMMQIAMGHVHEHFGQLIAYARSNQVVPPWSQTEG